MCRYFFRVDSSVRLCMLSLHSDLSRVCIWTAAVAGECARTPSSEVKFALTWRAFTQLQRFCGLFFSRCYLTLQLVNGPRNLRLKNGSDTPLISVSIVLRIGGVYYLKLLEGFKLHPVCSGSRSQRDLDISSMLPLVDSAHGVVKVSRIQFY